MFARMLSVFAVLVFFSFIGAKESAACTCLPLRPPAQAFAEADAVFLGKIISFEELVPEHQRRAHIEVAKIWKGNKEQADTLFTAFSEASCGYDFVVGETYLIYAHQFDKEFLSTNLCTRTRPAVYASEDLKYLDSVSYLPLALGNSWTFGSNFPGTTTETIIDTVRADGYLYYRFDQFREFSRPLLRMNDSLELIVRHENEEQVWLKFGAKIGESWHVYGPKRLAEWTVTLESTTDTVEVGAGRFFPCYRFYFKFFGADNDWIEWYAPNLGPVKRELLGFAVIEYPLASAIINGENVPTGVDDPISPSSPQTFELMQNYPNPFAPASAESFLSTTSIHYRLPRETQVTLTIYDILGRALNTLVQRRQGPGDYVVTWNGRDRRGEHVPSGVYFYKLTAGSFAQTRKLAVVQ
ncbi:T9SS C-terminal target domain-containing protein [candidate division KSB1 bacterium]|nr:MAG: T9SS C-terminal target domain-containing protein [candidate division KSB1 bacterium]MBC6951127.1 T9SS C-terminal target domain-containing protein [candidate division KSB1 bacterium]MCE7942977.1 T9SS C-terminal target domain-containing protein [Chlorobi bacterium CHB1]MDL1878372.1 T9SS type A sorting domain-containing protein [Cytophagia bacterium CHB2]